MKTANQRLERTQAALEAIDLRLGLALSDLEKYPEFTAEDVSVCSGLVANLNRLGSFAVDCTKDVDNQLVALLREII